MGWVVSLWVVVHRNAVGFENPHRHRFSHNAVATQVRFRGLWVCERARTCAYLLPSVARRLPNLENLNIPGPVKRTEGAGQNSGDGIFPRKQETEKVANTSGHKHVILTGEFSSVQVS